MTGWAVLAAGSLAVAGWFSAPVRLPLAGDPTGHVTQGFASPGRGSPPPRGQWAARVCVALVLAALALAVGVEAVPPTALPAAALLAVAAGGAGWLVARRRRRRAAVARADRILEACELLAAELEAGLPAGRALERAAEDEPMLASAAAAHALGVDVAGALRAAATTPGATGLARLAAAWDVSQRTGQRLAPAVQSAARGVRRDRATRRVVDAELASARATARLLAVLPVLPLLVGAGSRGWAFLLGTPLGVACLAAGLGLGLTGLVWIEQITDTAEKS